MKFLAVILLFLSQSAFAADGWTPKLIKEYVNADVFTQGGIPMTMGLYYSTGVMNSIKTVQNLGLAPTSICIPETGPVSIKDAINAVDPAGFPDTTQGGTMYIYSALLAKYPCKPSK